MNKESYRILKEINSLFTSKNTHIQHIIREEKRIEAIQQQRQERSHRLASVKEFIKKQSEALRNLENQIEENLKILNRSKQHLLNAIDQTQVDSLTNQIKSYSHKLEEAENEALELMEELETNENEKSEYEEFLVGSLETLEEIGREVKKTQKEEQEKITILEGRIQGLQDQLDPSFMQKYLPIAEKKLTHGALTKIQDKSCFLCKLSLSQVDIDAIEKNFKLKSCQGCSRIFIPTSTLY